MTPRRRKRDGFLPWVQLFLDITVIYFTLKTTFWFRFQSEFFGSTLRLQEYYIYRKFFYLAIIVLVFNLRGCGLYRPARFFTFTTEAGKIIKASFVSFLVLMAVTFFIRDFSFSRTFLVMAAIILATTLTTARVALGFFVMGLDNWRGSFRNILIVGCDEHSAKLVDYYKKNPRFSTRVAGFLDDKRELGSKTHGVVVVGRVKDLGKYIKEHREIHEVVLSLPGASTDQVLKIIYECEKELVTFRWIADILGIIASRMSVSHLSGVSLLSFTDSPLLNWENRALKRALDITMSFVGLVALSPLLLLLGILVKATSLGPLFYKQKRVGEDGRNFNIYKFRTMRADAERETGPVWARENDPRRTKLGTFLRENNLDELPQLWNVLRGDMSLVGPRPERPHFVSQFKEDIPRYMARHSIRSGITGWAQVNGLRGNTSIEERTKYDLYYIENWSIFLDLKIIFMTLFKFFSSPNAY